MGRQRHYTLPSLPAAAVWVAYYPFAGRWRDGENPARGKRNQEVAKKAHDRKKTPARGGRPSRKPARPASKALAARPVKQPAKSPLSKAELKHFRDMILAKRRALVGDMNGIEAGTLRTNRQEGTGDLSNMPTHPADIGSDNFEQEFTLGLLESERALLKEIDEALERIDGGTYGVCLGTGKPISKARLMARPWSKYCIEYARMKEKGLAPPAEEPQETEPLAEGVAQPAGEVEEEEEQEVEEEPEE